MGIYRTISKIIPKTIRDRLEKIIISSNITLPPKDVIGFFLSFIIGVSIIAGFLLGTFFKVNVITTSLLCAIVITLTFYFLAILSADKKTKFIEELLPDALQLMASNLRAGIGVEKSLLLAARPEFGPLEKEILIVGKEVATGKDIGHALLGMSARINSKALERIVKLIISGLRSGGKLSNLLENSAKDLRVQKLVKEKIRSNVQIYTIFIFIAAGFGAPLLFSLSLFLVKVIIVNFGSVDIPSSAASSIPISIKEVQVDPTFLLKYIMISISTTSVLSSFTLGLISKGKTKEGAKYIPLLLLLGGGVFFLTSLILKNILGELFAL